MNLLVFFFIFISYLSNFLISKLFFKKIILKGQIFGLFSVLSYSIFSSTSSILSKNIQVVSFRFISLLFLTNLLAIIFFTWNNGFFSFLIANILRSSISCFLSYFAFSIIKGSIGQGQTKKELRLLIIYIGIILLSFLTAFFILENWYIFTIFLINVSAFLFFFILGTKFFTEDLSINSLEYTKESFLRTVLVRAINNFVVSYVNKKNVLIIFALIINILIVVFKSALFVCLIFTLLFYFANNNKKSSLIFFIAFIVFTIARFSGSYYLNYYSKRMIKISSYFLKDKSYNIKKAYYFLTEKNNQYSSKKSFLESLSEYLSL